MKVKELIRNDGFDINCNAKVYSGDHNIDGELLYEDYNSDCNIEDVADMEISYITTDESGHNGYYAYAVYSSYHIDYTAVRAISLTTKTL